VELHASDEACADAARGAVASELQDGPPGCTLRLEQEGPLLHLHVEAFDVATMRAALASTVRLLDAALRAVRDES
jgi:tRNA threonylcarbamoyladenosine modification (KEOPS) complex  Pcc1 subunit